MTLRESMGPKWLQLFYVAVFFLKQLPSVS